MSKERQRRRAERERQKALAAAKRARAEARARRRRERAEAVKSKLPKRTRWASHQGRLADRRRRRIGLLFAAVFAVQVAVWLLSPSWSLRIGVLIVSLLAVPVAYTLLFGGGARR